MTVFLYLDYLLNLGRCKNHPEGRCLIKEHTEAAVFGHHLKSEDNCILSGRRFLILDNVKPGNRLAEWQGRSVIPA